MPLETATYINQLDAANPVGSDPIAAGDDHLRLIKSTIKNTFPNVTGAVTVTQSDLNSVAGIATNYVKKDGSIAMTGALVLPGDPSTSLQAATKGYVDARVAAATAGVASFNGRTGNVSLSSSDVTNALGYTPGTGNVSLGGNNTWTGLNVFTQYITSQYVNFTATSSIYYYSPANEVNIDHASSTVATFSNSRVYLLQNLLGKQLAPTSDNLYSLGTGGARWSVVYAGTGSINTSDVNAKQDIEDLSETEKRVAVAIKGLIKKFRFKDAVAAKGDSARIHIGVIAQEVQAAFAAEGLDANRYGLFCVDSWEAEPAKLDKDGNVVVPAKEAGTRLGVRYEELLAFVIAAI